MFLGQGGCLTYWHAGIAKQYRVTFHAGHHSQWTEAEPFPLCDVCVGEYTEMGHRCVPWAEKQEAAKSTDQLEFF